ncbi:hypothetical protein [Nodularia sp. UHCC 0506]|uniref:hypothetical protein n=1 Tax=Nodularia sp. UHCC 0506 TaxID=3110243 RepID=UPI002B1FD2D3|nr:hypothetical protein [Nodularia sp. UHCC 0506]MEA5513358.1 hypothetical protein [Nodularia sp. UHCC 0506]
MNLTSEVVWSLFLTSLIGLWLIWQAIKINSNIDIFKITVQWFSNRPIILPTLLFLIFPFLSTYIFRIFITKFNMVITNQIMTQILTTSGSVISIYVANRILERFKQSQEEKKVAKILVTSMEIHINILEEVMKYMSEDCCESQITKVENKVNQIRENYIYKSALTLVGVLKIKYVNLISKYYVDLDFLLNNDILNIYETRFKLTSNNEKMNKYIPTPTLGSVKIKIETFIFEAKCCIMKISKEILQDNEKFNKYKELLKREYKIHKKELEQYIADYNIEIYEQPLNNTLLMRIQTLFEEFRLLNELDTK